MEWVNEPDNVKDGDPVIDIVVHEANYAWDSELKAAASAGLTFAGWHDAGGDYPAGRFAGVGGKYVEVETDGGGNAVVRLSAGYRPVGIPAIKRAEKQIAQAEKLLNDARAGVQ